jgi:hypothetical protein
MQRFRGAWVALLLLVLGRLCVAGPPAPAPSPSPTPKPRPLGWQVQTGTLVDLNGSRSSGTYTRIVYNGTTLSEGGNKLKPTDATHVFSLDGTDRSDFSPDIKLDLLQGNGQTTNSTLNAFGVRRLNLGKTLKTVGYQAVARAAARIDGNQALVSGGFESAPLHPLRLPGWTNWLHIGAAGERFWQKRSLGQDESRGVLNYRAFFGKAAYRVNGERLKFTVDDIFQKAPTLEKLKPFLDSTATDAVSKFLQFWANFYDGATPAEKAAIEADYRAWLAEKAILENQQFGLAPTSALGLETEGWWTVAGNLKKRRASAIAALGYTRWFGVGSGGSFASSMQVRYEVGYDRAAPQTRVNRLLISANLNF